MIGRADTAYFKMINEQGGVNGRKINFISLDDGYSPPKTVEQTRRLVEDDGVSFMFNGLGTPTQLGDAQIPQRTARCRSSSSPPAPTSGAIPSISRGPWAGSRATAPRRDLRKYILQTKPDAKIGILYQNDDFGKDYLIGFKDGLGDKAKGMIVKEVSYETTDPTIDSRRSACNRPAADVS